MQMRSTILQLLLGYAIIHRHVTSDRDNGARITNLGFHVMLKTNSDRSDGWLKNATVPITWLSFAGVLLLGMFCTQHSFAEEPAQDSSEAETLPKEWKISFPVEGHAGLTHRRGDYLLASDQIWQIRKPKKLWTLPVRPTKGPGDLAIAIREDGKQVVIQEKDTATISLFGQKGPKKVLADEEPLICTAFLPSDRLVVVSQKELGKTDMSVVRLFETATQEVVNKFELPLGLYYSFEIDPLGNSVALVSSKDRDDPLTTICLYDLGTGKQTYKHIVERKGLGRASRAHLAFSNDGTRLACAMHLSGVKQPSEFLLVCMSPDSKDAPLEAKLPIRGVSMDLPVQFVSPGVWLLNYADQIGTYDEAKKSYTAISTRDRMYSDERILVITSKQVIVQQTNKSDWTKRLAVRDIAQLGKP